MWTTTKKPNKNKTPKQTNKKPTWSRGGDWWVRRQTAVMCCVAHLWGSDRLSHIGLVLWHWHCFLQVHAAFLPGQRVNLKSWSLHSICVKNFVLMSWYVLHCSRKCVSVPTCLCGQSWHSRSSLSSQVCQCWSVSMARLWSLSLYIVKISLSFSSVTVVRYSASVYCLFRSE